MPKLCKDCYHCLRNWAKWNSKWKTIFCRSFWKSVTPSCAETCARFITPEDWEIWINSEEYKAQVQEEREKRQRRGSIGYANKLMTNVMLHSMCSGHSRGF